MGFRVCTMSRGLPVVAGLAASMTLALHFPADLLDCICFTDPFLRCLLYFVRCSPILIHSTMSW